MRNALPAEVEVVSTRDGVRYVLPPQTGIPRGVGVLLLIFGLIPLAMGLWFGSLVLRTFDDPFPFNLFVLLLLVVPVFFGLVGLALLFLGAFFLAGRTEIELTRDSLSAAMRVGPFRWRGRRYRNQVLQLNVERLRSTATEALPVNGTLVAECDKGRRLSLAFSHPESLLTTLADHVAQQWAEIGGEPPLPVRHVGGTPSPSRSWRRSQVSALAEGSGCARVFNYAFFGAFFVAGCTCLCLIGTALVRGDPDNHLQGDFPFKYLWGLFPIPFLAVGAGGLLYHLRRRSRGGLSPEQQAAGPVATVDSPHDALPTIPSLATTPGTELAHRVPWSDSPVVGVVLFLVLLLICSGVLTPMVYNVLQMVRIGKNVLDAVLSSGFFLLFLGVVWVLLVGAVIHNWRQWRLGQPIVELSACPLFPGETYDIMFSLPETMRLSGVTVTILCEEEARYREGTDTRTETRCTYREELVKRPGPEAWTLPPSEGRHRFRVPPGAMHSFETSNNKIRWLVRIERKAAGAFTVNFKHDFPLLVHPPQGGRA